jgi:hypothetical protein
VDCRYEARAEQVGRWQRGGIVVSIEGPLRVEVTVTERDVFRFLLYDALHSPLIMVIVVAISVLLFDDATNFVRAHFRGTPVGLAALYGFLGPAAFLSLCRGWLWLKAKRAGQAVIGAIGDRTLEISPKGVRTASARGQAELKWTTFARIVGTPHAIYFYMGQRIASVIPRRAFPSPMAADTFLQAARAWRAAATQDQKA